MLCYFVHTVRTDLHLNPTPLLAHKRYVQCLVAVGLRMVDPVSQAVGMRLVDLAYCYVDVEAFVHFFFSLLWLEDYAHGENVVDLVEGDVLVLHLVPNGIRAFHARLYLIFNAHFVQRFAYRRCEVGEKALARRLCVGKLVFYQFVLFWMFELEAKVFKFSLDFVQSKPVGKWCVDVKRLSCNLVLLVGRLAVKCAHVVQAVAYFYEYDANVVAHGEQQFFEVFGLG